MEGVGARLGRSSTRYGPTTVFTGPVRKWKKKWVQVTPPSSSNNHNYHHVNGAMGNGGNNGSHLLLFKWAPISSSQNKENGSGDNPKNGNREDIVAADEPPKRKIKYIPVAVLEEKNFEELEQMDDEARPIETDPILEPISKSDGLDETPDINDVPKESQDAGTKPDERRQDLNESLDLSLGLKAHDGGNVSESKTDQTNDAV